MPTDLRAHTYMAESAMVADSIISYLPTYLLTYLPTNVCLLPAYGP
jgi:hypothetical protein